METKETNEAILNVVIGQKVFEILNLKMNKKTGRIETMWGNKTIQGLGATIMRIVQEETNCVPKEDYDKAISEINRLQIELAEALDDLEN